MKEFTIGEVARLVGIQTSAIRYYESKGLLPRPKRLNGRRRYDPNVLKRLGLIRLSRQAGFGISELQAMFGGSPAEASAATPWQRLLTEKIAELDALINRTQATKAWLVEMLQRDCPGAEECVTFTLDEAGTRANVTFSCENSRLTSTRSVIE